MSRYSRLSESQGTNEGDQTQSLLNGHSRAGKQRKRIGYRALFLVTALTCAVFIYSQTSSDEENPINYKDEDGVGMGLHAKIDEASFTQPFADENFGLKSNIENDEENVSEEPKSERPLTVADMRGLSRNFISTMPTFHDTSTSKTVHMCSLQSDDVVETGLKYATEMKHDLLQHELEKVQGSTDPLKRKLKDAFKEELNKACCQSCAAAILFENAPLADGRSFCAAWKTADATAKLALQKQIFGCPTSICTGIGAYCEVKPDHCPPGYFSQRNGIQKVDRNTGLTASLTDKDWKELLPAYARKIHVKGSDKDFVDPSTINNEYFVDEESNGCFKYVFKIPGLPFNNARSFCRHEGGDLAWFTSAKELRYVMLQTYLTHQVSPAQHTAMKPMIGYILKDGNLLGVDEKIMTGKTKTKRYFEEAYLIAREKTTWKYTDDLGFKDASSVFTKQQIEEAFTTNSANKAQKDVMVMRIHQIGNHRRNDQHEGLIFKIGGSWRSKSGTEAKGRDALQGFICRVNSDSYLTRRNMAFPATGAKRLCEIYERSDGALDKYTECMHYAKQFTDTAFLQKFYSIAREDFRKTKSSKMSPNCCKPKTEGTNKVCPWGRGTYNQISKKWELKEGINYCSANGLEQGTCEAKVAKKKGKLWVDWFVAILGTLGSVVGLIMNIINPAFSLGYTIFSTLFGGANLLYTLTGDWGDSQGTFATGVEQDYCHTIAQQPGFWPAELEATTKYILSCDVANAYYNHFKATSDLMLGTADMWASKNMEDLNRKNGWDLLNGAAKAAGDVGTPSTAGGVFVDGATWIHGANIGGIAPFTNVAGPVSAVIGIVGGIIQVSSISYKLASWNISECQEAPAFSTETSVYTILNAQETSDKCFVKFFKDDKFAGPYKLADVTSPSAGSTVPSADDTAPSADSTSKWKLLSTTAPADMLASFRVVGPKCLLTICESTATPPTDMKKCMSFKRGNWQLPSAADHEMNMGQYLQYKKTNTNGPHLVKQNCTAKSKVLASDSYCWPAGEADLADATNIFQIPEQGVAKEKSKNYSFKIEVIQ